MHAGISRRSTLLNHTETKKQGKRSIADQETDNWDKLLSKTRFEDYYESPLNCLSPAIPNQLPGQVKERERRPLGTEELKKTKKHLLEKIQRGILDDTERPRWTLV